MSVLDHWPVVDLTGELGRLAMSTDVEWDEQDQGDETQRLPITPELVDELAPHAIAGLLGITLRELLATMRSVVAAVGNRDAHLLKELEIRLWRHRGDAETALADAKANGIVAAWGPADEVMTEASTLHESIRFATFFTPEAMLEHWPSVGLTTARYHALRGIVEGLHLELEEAEDGTTVSHRPDEASTTTVPAGESPAKTDKTKRKGRSYKAVREELESARVAGKPWGSYDKWAEELKCSVATVHKAATGDGSSADLQDWANGSVAAILDGKSQLELSPEASEVAIASTPQSREPDPSDITEDSDIDMALAFLKAEFPDLSDDLARMPPDQHRAVAEIVYRDTDRADKVDQFRRKHRVRD